MQRLLLLGFFLLTYATALKAEQVLHEELYQLQVYDCDFVAWAAETSVKFRDEGRTKIETVYLFWSDYKMDIPRYRALMNLTSELIDQIYSEWKHLPKEDVVGLADRHCSYRIGEYLSTGLE